jgi:predicted GIY-YIG superfamily endonuclease
MSTGRPKFYDVYLLIDPRDGRVFYVGCTSDLPKRIEGHMNSHPTLRGFGIEPIVAVVHARKNKDFAMAQERKLIEQLAPISILTNRQYARGA